MLSLQTLKVIEALLTSRNDPRWGELPILVQLVGELQQAQQLLTAVRTQPAPDISSMPVRPVPGPSEPSTPPGHVAAR